jgi:hypothetical protein
MAADCSRQLRAGSHHARVERLDLGRGLLAVVGGFLAGRMIVSRLLVAVTIAGPVIAAAVLRAGRRWPCALAGRGVPASPQRVCG